MGKVFIGVDFGYKPSLFRRILIWLGIGKKFTDGTCTVICHRKNGVIYIDDIKYL